MIWLLSLLTFLAAPAYAADVTVNCFNPSGGANSAQPCQYSNAAPVATLVSGSGSGTNTSAHTIIGAQGANIKMYISSVQCFRTDAGTTADFVTLNDNAATVIGIPNGGGGGGNNIVFQIPIIVAANTAFTFTANAGVSTIYCDAQGYQGQ
jgi:hypothetical protein